MSARKRAHVIALATALAAMVAVACSPTADGIGVSPDEGIAPGTGSAGGSGGADNGGGGAGGDPGMDPGAGGPSAGVDPGAGSSSGGGNPGGSSGGPAKACPPMPTARAKTTVNVCGAGDKTSTAEVERVAGDANGVVGDCQYYVKTLNCYQGSCGECSRARIFGYYQTCRNMGQVANGSSPNLPSAYATQCRQDCSFTNYVNEMRRCLQDESRSYVNGLEAKVKRDATCTEVVDGEASDSTSGIIGAHTKCNAKAGFCTKLTNSDRECFGYALGNSWGPVCPAGGGFTAGGSFSSVGVCHFMSEVLSCARSGVPVSQFLDHMCKGYQDGCNQTDPCNALSGLGCQLACPRPGDLATLAGFFRFFPGAQFFVRPFLDIMGRLMVAADDASIDRLQTDLETLCTGMVGREQAGCKLNGAYVPGSGQNGGGGIDGDEDE